MLSRIFHLFVAAMLVAMVGLQPAGAEKNYKAERGTPPCLTWIDPDKEPRAVLLCVHGCGLHNGTFKDWGEAMSKRGFAVYAVDVRGFGSFQHKAGQQNIDLQGCVWDVEETLRILHKAHPNLPVYLLGESMGGAIALRAASLNPKLVDGLIASVPAGERFKQHRTDLRVAFHALTGGLSKKFDIGTTIVNQSTKKPELAKEWSEDPLARMNLSPLELLQFDRFCKHNLEMAKNLNSTPVLYVQGCRDQLIKPESTLKLFHATASPDKWLLQIGNAEHLIFEEHQFNDAIVDLVTKWMDHPTPKKAALDGESASCAVTPKQAAQGAAR
jgi:acylglycerol lipase